MLCFSATGQNSRGNGVFRTARQFNNLSEREKTMGKGDNNRKNDKKNKKPKKDAKKPAAKSSSKA
jgi:hypothetical protein